MNRILVLVNNNYNNNKIYIATATAATATTTTTAVDNDEDDGFNDYNDRYAEVYYNINKDDDNKTAHKNDLKLGTTSARFIVPTISGLLVAVVFKMSEKTPETRSTSSSTTIHHSNTNDLLSRKCEHINTRPRLFISSIYD